MISLHDHPVRFPLRMEETPEYNRTGRQHAAYAGLAASGMTVVFDNMMDGTACVTGNAPWRWDDIITDLGMRQADLAQPEPVMVVRTVADIDEAHRSGRVGLVFGLEAATPIENEIDRLDVLYGLGLRQIGIAYSDANALGSGLAEATDGGPDRVRPAGGDPDEQARAGHRRVALLATAPPWTPASAASGRCSSPTPGARAVWDTPRMKPDDVLRAVAGTGGRDRHVGCPAHHAVGRASAAHHRVGDGPLPLLRRPGRHRACRVRPGHALRRPCGPAPDLRPPARPSARCRGPSFEPVAYVDGLENPTENFANICGWLVQHGFSDEDIRAVLGGNTYRALQSIWIA